MQEQIVIGTPGTIYDWCSKQKAFDPKKITMFVLDEADVMIAMQGHRDQSIRIQRWVLLSLRMPFWTFPSSSSSSSQAAGEGLSDALFLRHLRGFGVEVRREDHSRSQHHPTEA